MTSLVGVTFFVEGFGARRKDIIGQITRYGGKISYILSKECRWIVAENSNLISPARLESCRLQPSVVLTERQFTDLLSRATPPPPPPPDAPVGPADSSSNSTRAPSVVSQATVASSAITSFSSASTQKKGGPIVPAALARQPNSRIPADAPSVTLVLPDNGNCQGGYKLAIFGIGFKPASFRLQIGTHILSSGFEWHCASALVVHLPSLTGVLPGEVLISVSNDGGAHFGMSVKFTFNDPFNSYSIHTVDERTAVLSGQLQNLSRALQQLQAGYVAAARLEAQLRGELPPSEGALEFAGALAVVPAAHATAVPAVKGPKATPAGSRPAAGQQPPTRPSTPAAPAAASTVDRELKIFISSPFKDMQEERDLLVKRVIPRLKRLCGERDVVLTYVDLRWGVTGVQGEQAATLLMCLRELDKSNVFIGCYGARYGWCRSSDANTALKQTDKDILLARSMDMAEKEFPWVNDYRDRSVTEIEMRMILHSFSSTAKKSWFFMRDPYYAEHVPADKKEIFVSEGDYEAAKLEELKNDINGSGNPCLPYERPTALAESVQTELERYIEAQFPRDKRLSDIQSDRFRHLAYARAYTRIYLPNEANFLILDKYVSGNNASPFAVLGETGYGKSALIANWLHRHRAHHPEDVVVSHFIGATPTSTNYTLIVSRILEDLNDQLGANISLPSADLLVNEFPSLLERALKAANRGRLVLVIDGLDMLDERDGGRDLVWLPYTFPARVRVILSTAPGQCQNILKRRNYETLEMKPIEEGERVAFLRLHLNWHSKRLSEKQEYTVSAAKQTSNPRFLKILLEDICVFGDFERLDKRILHDLRARNAADLYEIVLERLETDYEKETNLKDVVKNILSLIWASRNGLFQSELSRMMEARQIQAHQWEPALLQCEDLLLSAGGLLNFANRDIAHAVENRYFSRGPIKKQTHTLIASFFQSSPDVQPQRRMEELPWQLERAEEYEKLRNCIGDLKLLVQLYPNGKFDLTRYWRSVEKNTKFDAVSTYTEALKDSNNFPADVIRADVYYKVACFLEDSAKFDGALRVFSEALVHYTNAAQNLAVAKTNYAIARIYSTQGRYDEAEKALKDTLAVYARELGEDSVDSSHVLNRLGALYLDTNHLSEAEAAFKKTLAIRQAKLGPSHSRVGQTLKHMLTLYELMERFDEATECGRRALAITEQEFGPDDVNVAGILRRIGQLEMNQRKFKQARETLNRALAIATAKFGPEHPNTGENLYGLGCVAFLEDKHEEAEEFFRNSLRIKEAALGDSHPDVARIINRLGTLYIEQARYAEAESAFTRALSIYEKRYGPTHSRVGQVLKHLITLYESQEKRDKALECGQRALRITEKIFGPEHFHVSSILVRLGVLLFSMNRSGDALPYLQRAKELRTKKNGPDHPTVKDVEHVIEELTTRKADAKPVAKKEIDLDDVNVVTDKSMLKNNTRDALLQEIEQAAKRKQLKKALEETSKPKKKAQHSEWYRQGYQYAGELPKPMSKPMSKPMVMDRKVPPQQQQMQMQMPPQLAITPQLQQVAKPPPVAKPAAPPTRPPGGGPPPPPPLPPRT